MARIKDLIAAIVSTGDGFGDIVRIITAASHSAEPVQGETLAAILSWVSSQSDNPVMKAMAGQGVTYKKVNLKSGTPSHRTDPQFNASQSNVTERVRRFLHELQVRDELNYPFIVIASHGVLLISAVDLDIIMAIARQQQMEESNPEISKDRRPFKNIAPIVPPE